MQGPSAWQAAMQHREGQVEGHADLAQGGHKRHRTTWQGLAEGSSPGQPRGLWLCGAQLSPVSTDTPEHGVRQAPAGGGRRVQKQTSQLHRCLGQGPLPGGLDTDEGSLSPSAGETSVTSVSTPNSPLNSCQRGFGAPPLLGTLLHRELH